MTALWRMEARHLARSPLLWLGMVMAAAAVAFAYGPVADPAYELVATTPTSPLQALLVRLAAVLVVNSVLAGAIDLATAGGGSPGGWLLPMTSAALLAVVVASRSAPVVGALAGMGAWLLVLGAWAASDQPVARLTAPSAQAAYAAVAAILLALLVRSTAGRGWPFPGVGWESPS